LLIKGQLMKLRKEEGGRKKGRSLTKIGNIRANSYIYIILLAYYWHIFCLFIIVKNIYEGRWRKEEGQYLNS
jgi:hypothetical protein